jgi:hypothetical protein
MQPFHRRLAEIWDKVIDKKPLTLRDCIDWSECLTAHRNWVSKLNRLENLADAAAAAGDQKWENEICKEMDKLIYRH